MAFSNPNPFWILIITTIFLLLPTSSSTHQPSNPIHHRNLSPPRSASPGPPRKRADGRDTGIPLVISNQCAEPLWPAMQTQAGTGPGTGGFLLAPGASRNLTLGGDWAGRVWGRTNCSFNAEGTASSRGSGQACDTGDCAGLMDCAGPVSFWFCCFGLLSFGFFVLGSLLARGSLLIVLDVVGKCTGYAGRVESGWWF